MRIFKNKWFVKFANKEKISDQMLNNAIYEVMQGRLTADL